MKNSSSAHLLEDILEPVSDSLNEEAARKLIGIRANPDAQARIGELATKCSEGEISPEERAEYETYVLAGELVAILQAKARRLLGGRNVTT